MKRSRFLRFSSGLAASATLLQITACLGPDPRGFVEDSLFSAFWSNIFAILSETLFRA